MRNRWMSLMSFLLALILFGGASGLIILGANLSQRMDAQARQDLADRSLRLYFNQRFKQHDGLKTIETYNEGTILVFNTEDYVVMIYEEDGQLWEQTSDVKEILPGAGQAIGEGHDFKVSLIDHQWVVDYVNMQDVPQRLSFASLSEDPS